MHWNQLILVHFVHFISIIGVFGRTSVELENLLPCMISGNNSGYSDLVLQCWEGSQFDNIVWNYLRKKYYV
jgi:hypothetical protein